MEAMHANSRRAARWLVVVGAVALVLGSCARRMAFEPSTVVPAAEGRVKVKKDANDNFAIEVKTYNLADPEALRRSGDVYVVWMETRRDGVRNLGQLKSSSGLFSKTLKGSLETVSSFRPERVFITAERDGNVSGPSRQVVLTTK